QDSRAALRVYQCDFRGYCFLKSAVQSLSQRHSLSFVGLGTFGANARFGAGAVFSLEASFNSWTSAPWRSFARFVMRQNLQTAKNCRLKIHKKNVKDRFLR